MILFGFTNATALEPSSLTGVITVALKLLAIVIGTFLGALGLLKKSVEDTGKLTRWGR